MNNSHHPDPQPVFENMRGVILKQNARLQLQEDQLTFWRIYGILMTAACLVVTALACRH